MNHKLKISCSRESLKDVRDFVNKTLTNLCVPEMEINMIVLAVDEICANRIIHSNHCNTNQHLEINIKDDAEGVIFEISDEGEFYDPTNYEEPNIPGLIREKRKGGLGLMLVKRIMDSFEVKKENTVTICRLFKKVHTCGA